MPDSMFEDRRLAELYDPLDPGRSDLECYVALVEELGAGSVLDIGCGTGTFACMLAKLGVDVIGVDPAGASLDVARAKPFAEAVRWVHADAANLPDVEVDLVTMTGNVAQVFLRDHDWASVLGSTSGALKPGGHLVFEVRVPEREGWRAWTRDQSFCRSEVPGVGGIEKWVELTDVRLPFVSFQTTFAFEADGSVLTSDSTLRFRSRMEIEESLREAGFVVEEVRDAPDRPGLEYVFLARRGS